MKPLVVTLLIALSLSSCHSKKANADEYYTEHGDWDDVGFPLIKPYEALCLNGSHNWIVQTTQDAVSAFSAPGTRKVNIVHQVIFLYSTKTRLNGADARKAWFVLIPAKYIEKGFTTHQEYLDYLHLIGIEYEPKLCDIDEVSKCFGDHDIIDWKQIGN